MSEGMSARQGATATWTVATMLAWATPFLTTKGSESARLDAELLLAHVLGVRRLDLYLDGDRPLDRGELDAFRAVIKRRAAAEPVAYILGRRAFHAIELEVGPGVLVPRPETEHLVDRVLAALGPKTARSGAERPPTSPIDGPIIDVGTGSGAIALALAAALRDRGDERLVYGVDLSADALAYAARNLAALGLDGVRLGHGALLGAFADVGPFAALVSNPPYVRAERLATLPLTVRGYEPRIALDGGVDGLDVLRALVALVPEALVPGGLFAVELGDPDQGQTAADALEARGMVDARVERVSGGPTSLVLARRPTT